MMSILAGLKWSIGVLSIICLGILCFGTVSAVMVSSPDVVKPGEEVSVFVGNLENNVPVSVLVVGDIKTDAGSFFSYGIHDLKLNGLKLNSPILNIYLQGLLYPSKVNVTLIQKNGDIYIALPPKAVKQDGTCEVTNLQRPTLDDNDISLTINGTAAKTQVPVTVELTGTSGSATSFAECNFNIRGFSNGVFDVITKVNNVDVERKQFTVQDQLIAIK